MAADSQYIIDIAAELPDGEATISELDALSKELTGAGKNSDSFQAAIKRVSSDLDAAKAVTAKANVELRDGADRYKDLEQQAVRAGKALERAQLRKSVPIETFRAAQRTAEALRAYTPELRRLEDAAEEAAGAQSKLANSLRKTERLASHVDARNARLSDQFTKVNTAVGFLPGKLGAVTQTLTSAGQAGHELNVAMGASRVAMIATVAAVALVVVGVIALTAAVVAGTITFAKYAAGMGDARREADLTREALSALNPETKAAVSAFDEVAEATGLADAELTALTKKLQGAKVAAADMPKALRAAATAEAALGAGGSDEFIQRITDGKTTVSEFAAEVDTKFGGIVAKRMRGLSAQSSRFSRLWAKLFDGLNMDPVLRAVDRIVGMFDEGNPLAQAFGMAMRGVFNFITKHAEGAAVAVEAFALGFAIQMTKIFLAARPVLRWVADLFGFEDKDGTLLDLVGGLGRAFAGVVVVGGALIGVLTAVVLSALALPAAFGAAALAVGLGVRAVLDDVFGFLSDIGATIKEKALSIGGDLMQGLVDGITGNTLRVVNAVADSVQSVIDAGKSVLGIASPSKVFHEMGEQTGEGYAGGVEDSAPMARRSLSELVSPEITPSDSGGGGSSSGQSTSARAGSSLGFAGATFNFYGVEDAATATDRFREMLNDLLEEGADALTGAEVA